MWFYFTKIMLEVACMCKKSFSRWGAGEVKNPRGKPTITTFLNQNNLQLHSKYRYSDPHTSVVLPPSLQFSAEIITEIHSWSE